MQVISIKAVVLFKLVGQVVGHLLSRLAVLTNKVA